MLMKFGWELSPVKAIPWSYPCWVPWVSIFRKSASVFPHFPAFQL